jgi:diguanylate cyclase (GGDEF)-like protein
LSTAILFDPLATGPAGDTMIGVSAVPRNAPANGRACLVRIHPPTVGEGPIHLASERTVLGRDRDCDIALCVDGAVSRRHAAIELRDDLHVIVDLRSTNGTYVNDEAIRDRTLSTGDLVRVGGHIFKYLCNDLETQFHQTVYQMMITDSLTGVHSKRYFQESFDRELVRAMRHRRSLALVLFDIDHFKVINDTHSHLVGDEVLRELCHRVSPAIRKDEVFARWGGEEFAILLPEASVDEARNFCERLRQLIADNPIQIGSLNLQITASVGYCVADGVGDTSITDMMQTADANLYRAKAAGRNCVIG